MKSIWIFIFSLLFISCSKEDKLICDSCYMNMYLNGISWQADKFSAFLFKDGVVSLLGFSFDSFGQERESLSFGGIPLEAKKFSLFSGLESIRKDGEVGVFFSTNLSDGDVLGAVYELVNDEVHELIINTLDLEENVIEGSFQLTLLKESDPRPALNFPDTIRITQGIFRSDITME